jgi:hypothetical protein
MKFSSLAVAGMERNQWPGSSGKLALAALDVKANRKPEWMIFTAKSVGLKVTS